MIVGLRKLEMNGDLIIHFISISISGKRTIAQGTDGLSRADLSSGVMSGQKFLIYLPTNKIAFERQACLKPD